MSDSMRSGMTGDMRNDMRNVERQVVLASADAGLRQRLRDSLTGLRWHVHEACGGAEALTLLERQPSDALVIDGWLPDLETAELAGHIAMMYPAIDLLGVDGGPLSSARSAHRHELLHALREAQHVSPAAPKTDTAAWNAAPAAIPKATSVQGSGMWIDTPSFCRPGPLSCAAVCEPSAPMMTSRPRAKAPQIPGLVGSSAAMMELGGLIRLVAPRNTTVLIEGETGTGKEVVASAIHRLSTRSSKPLVVLNCAAIPESLLEAELFGHTRGAFTGAIQARPGRIEAAHGGTLFLDEIGELPMAVQAKLLRFLECGELQRVGDNDVTRVNVRVIAATHRDLEQRVVDGEFRLDLYHRLAVFPIEVPSLREHPEDLPELAEYLLGRLGTDAPRKLLTPEALAVLGQHNWPGNVRELAHVLERAVILAGDLPEISGEHIRYRRKPR